jgi:HAD superfamily hydrolase (TIGR01490 family)
VQLAVFDLDGTITRHDTLVPYVAGFLRRRPWRWLGALLMLPWALLFALGLADHGTLKAHFIRFTLGGCRRGELADYTERFVARLLEHGVFAEALTRIAAHRNGADRLVLMSASTDLYVPVIARLLKFDEVICTGVRWDGDTLRGDLTTPNRRGHEKTRCLQALQAQHAGIAAVAYGNARSDLEHLRLAQQGYLVNGSPAVRREAQRLGLLTLEWR